MISLILVFVIGYLFYSVGHSTQRVYNEKY